METVAPRAPSTRTIHFVTAMSFITRSLGALALAAAAVAPHAGRAGAQETHSAHGATAAASGPVRLLDGLGAHHRRVATTDPRAQRFFDQGLRLAYAFNHG